MIVAKLLFPAKTILRKTYQGLGYLMVRTQDLLSTIINKGRHLTFLLYGKGYWNKKEPKSKTTWQYTTNLKKKPSIFKYRCRVNGTVRNEKNETVYLCGPAVIVNHFIGNIVRIYQKGQYYYVKQECIQNANLPRGVNTNP